MLWKILPPFIRRYWSRGKASWGWFGNYSDWAQAQNDASGYDQEEILEKVRTSLMKVKKGEAAYERDSVAFDKLELEPVVAEWLTGIASDHGNELKVVDFGGSLGSTYFQYRNSIGSSKIKGWTVVEQEHFVEAGRKDFQDGVLRFDHSLDEALTSSPDVLLLFSVLPYLEDPYALIKRITASEVPYIIVDRTPFIDDVRGRITVQVVPEFIYKASYPAWFFEEKEFLKAFQDKYDVVRRYNCKFASPYVLSDGKRAEWKGFVFKRR